MAKPKNPSFVLKGIARYPHLTDPDSFNGKNSYCVDLVVDPKDAATAKVIDALNAIRDAGVEEAKADMKPAQEKKINIVDVLKAEEDTETGEPTGRFFVRMKQLAKIEWKNAQGEPKSKDMKPRITDSQKNIVTAKITGGSEIIVAFDALQSKYQFDFCTQCRPTAVRVLSLKEYDADDSQFDEFEGEGDYVATPAAPAAQESKDGFDEYEESDKSADY